MSSVTSERTGSADSPPLPLECLRFFDAAARHGSFVGAAREIRVTPAAVAYRIRVLESHLGYSLFDRSAHGIALNERGKAFFGDVNHILAEIGELVDRHCGGPARQRVNVVAVDAVAERWLMPKLADFGAARPDIAIVLETDASVDPNHQDSDVWITYVGAGSAPTDRTALRETLFEETLLPVCSPALLIARGQPRGARDLHSWPLVYHLGLPSDWALWFAAQGELSPDLSQASGFRLFGMQRCAAVAGMGATISCPTLIAPELERGALVPLIDRHVETSVTCSLITTAAARRKPQVQELREWILRATAAEGRPHPSPPAAVSRVVDLPRGLAPVVP